MPSAGRLCRSEGYPPPFLRKYLSHSVFRPYMAIYQHFYRSDADRPPNQANYGYLHHFTLISSPVDQDKRSKVGKIPQFSYRKSCREFGRRADVDHKTVKARLDLWDYVAGLKNSPLPKRVLIASHSSPFGENARAQSAPASPLPLPS